MVSKFKRVNGFLGLSLLSVVLLTGCVGEEPKPEIYMEPGVEVVYLDDLELQGKVYFIDLKIGEFIALGSDIEHNDYDIHWDIISDNTNIGFVTAPDYDEKGNLTAFSGITAMNEGRCIVTLKERDGNNIAYFEVKISR